MFKLEIETENAAFTDGVESEVARIMRDLAAQFGDHPHDGEGKVRDYNGNTVGTWSLTQPEPDLVPVAREHLEKLVDAVTDDMQSPTT